MRIIALTLFVFVLQQVWGQQTTISFGPASNGQTINTCNGFIIDSGGQGGPGYSNGENVTITICPDTPGEIMNIVFNLFALSTVDDNPSPAITNLDYMDVYDGNSTAAPTLGTYSGNQLQGVVIQATALNPTGCLTLRFRSNSTGTGMFTASATCETPCATPTAAGVIVGGATTDSIRVCVGELVDFANNGSFAEPGFTLTDFEWDFMDGSSANGQNVSHSFDTPGQYRVQLFVTDDNGCGNTNLIDLEVFVATIPQFVDFPSDTTLCIGESITFSTDPETYEVIWDGFEGSQWIDDGCLPDTLLGVSQDIEIMQTGFSAGSTITSIADVESICLDLEHSFMGDLVIILECPNGQTEILHQQGGGGTQIGEPNPEDNVDCSDPSTQGVPYNYCFTTSATETWVEWVTNSGGLGGALPAGDYEPIEPMTNLIGCPLNGIWTLTVIDNWAADDGTLFGFSINLDPALYPPVTVFEPQIGLGADSSYWETPAPYMTSLSANADVITITPTVAGTYTYTYHVIDDFGCEHDTSVTVTVNDNLLPDAGPDIVVCDGNPVQLNGSVAGLGGSSPCTYNLNLVDQFGDGWGGCNVTVTINGVPTVYNMPANISNQDIPIQIPHGATVSIVFFDDNNFNSWDCEYTLTDPYGNVLVDQGGNFIPPNTNPTNFTADCFNGYVFQWTTGIGTFDNASIPGPIGTFNIAGPVTLTVYPNGHPLCATTDQLNVTLSASADPGEDSTLTICSQGAAQDLFPLLGPNASPNGSWTNPAGAPVAMPYNPVTMNPGVYSYSVDSNGCVSVATVTVTEINTSINIAVTNVSCFGANNGSIVATVTNATSYTLDGGPSQPIAGNLFTINNLAPGTYVVDVYGSNGCTDQETFTITQPQQMVASISPDVTICPGETTTLTAVGVGGSSPYTFTWFTGITVLGAGASFDVTPVATTQYCVILTEACGSVPDTACMTVSHPNPIIPLFTPDVTSGCFPVPVSFTNVSTGGTVASMFVDYGDGTSETLIGMAGADHVYELPGVYTVTLDVTSDVGCHYTATFPNLITVYDKPIAYFNIMPNPVSMFNPYVQLLNASSSDVVTYDWHLDGGTPATSANENVNAQFPDGVAANYDVTLYVTNNDGCVDSITRVVQVISEVLLYAPNAFTPDGDEFNQTWRVFISGIDVAQFELIIYNRWGEIVWQSHDYEAEWDGTYKGKIVQDGTYNWTIETKDVTNDKKYQFQGSFNVIH
jgi:gliding motility-associated-like protein